MPKCRSSPSSAVSSSPPRSVAAASSAQARRVAASRLRAGGGGISRGPGAEPMRSTRNTSAPSSRNTPPMPVCEAMPASFAFMLSNSGPSVRVSS